MAGGSGARAWVLLGRTALAIASAACAEASGEVRSGPVVDLPPQESAPVCFDEGKGPGGTRFTDLHRDFFGPTAPSRCAGGPGANCHGTESASGAQVSGFACGEDARACRRSLLSSNLVAPGDPEGSPLLGDLRRYTPEGTLELGVGMPKIPACAFSAASMERMRAWIAAGAPDD